MPSADLPTILQLQLPPLPTDIPLPPLPPISDPTLDRQAFTHSSFHAKRRGAAGGLDLTAEGQIEDNEKLEHVGDALLGMVVTTLLHELYPNLKHGPATMLKGHLVNNATLSQLSNRYGLPSRLIAAPAEVNVLRRGEKVTANLFEAYVAALYYSHLTSAPPRIPTPPRTPSKHGSADALSPYPSSRPSRHGTALEAIEEWLFPLFTPFAEWVLDQMRLEQARLDELAKQRGGESELDQEAVGAMATLNQHFIFQEGGMPEYAAKQAGEGMWYVQVQAKRKDGDMLYADATRSTKKQASTIAAWKLCKEVGLTN